MAILAFVDYVTNGFAQNVGAIIRLELKQRLVIVEDNEFAVNHNTIRTVGLKNGATENDILSYNFTIYSSDDPIYMVSHETKGKNQFTLQKHSVRSFMSISG